MASFFKKAAPAPRFGALLPVVGFAALLGLFYAGVNSTEQAAGAARLDQLEQAVRQSAVHCYTVEGRYPESLDYLKEEYGLSYDEAVYRVDYEIFASNLAPLIRVEEK